MKIHIETRPDLRKPNLEKPIELDGVKVFKNKKGQWVLSFSSKNHKYLNINYNIAGSHINGEHCKFGAAHGFEIETCETWFDEEWNLEVPEDKVTLWLIPESKEEGEELSGREAVLPEKWSYSVCIVPYEDFYD